MYKYSFAKKAFMCFCKILPGKIFWNFVKGPKKTGNFVHGFFGGASKYSKSVFSSKHFKNPVQLYFNDGEYSAPAEYDELLKNLYGDYMRIPSPEERKCKQHAFLVDLKKSYENYETYRDGMKFDVHTRSIR